VILVDDGSTDSSATIATEFGWKKLRVLRHPINMGHQAALDTGIRAAKGDWVLTMDSDLQHPPRQIADFISIARSNNVDVIYGVRPKRNDDSLLKRSTAALYYKLMRGLTDLDIADSAADFRLLSRRVVTAINALPPGPKVFRLLIPSLGFPSTTLEFQADKRIFGESKYTLKKMIGLLVTSTVSFSTKPLWISIQLGLLFGLLSLLGIFYTVSMFFSGETVPGWASTSSAVLLLFSINFLILGVLGLYLGELINTLKITAIASEVQKKI
jgi:dolichol-phosphate mannosyltransferase